MDGQKQRQVNKYNQRAKHQIISTFAKKAEFMSSIL